MSDNIKRLIFFLVIIGLVGTGLYRLSSLGKLPVHFNFPNFRMPGPIQSTSPNYQTGGQNTVVVSEEDAIIRSVEKASPSVVAIGVTQTVFNPFDPFTAPRE